MKVSRRTLPARSAEDTVRPSVAVSTYAGAWRMIGRRPSTGCARHSVATGAAGLRASAGPNRRRTARERTAMPGSVQQHVVGPMRAPRQLGEIHVEERVELEPPVGP